MLIPDTKGLGPDQLWKSILEDFFIDFVRYFFGPYLDLFDLNQPVVFLDTELSKLHPAKDAKNRIADKLARLAGKDGQPIWLYIHSEIQGYPDPEFDQRMFTMKYRLRERYGSHVASIAILVDKSESFRPGLFEDNFMGNALSYKYNTFKLKDHNPDALLKGTNPFGLVLQTAWYHLFGSTDDHKILATKKQLVRRLMGFGYPFEQTLALLRFINYYVTFKEVSAHHELVHFINDTLQIYQTMGINELVETHFREVGRQEGRQEGIVAMLKNGKNTTKEIADLFGIPVAEVEAVKKLLESGQA